jgi:hypothetical protein
MLHCIPTTKRARPTQLANLSATVALSATGAALLGIQITQLENKCKALRRRSGAGNKEQKANAADARLQKISVTAKHRTNGRALRSR